MEHDWCEDGWWIVETKQGKFREVCEVLTDSANQRYVLFVGRFKNHPLSHVIEEGRYTFLKRLDINSNC